MGKLDNEVIAANKVSKNKISIERRKFVQASIVKTYAFCYEYIITNSTGSDIKIQNFNGFYKSDFIPGYSMQKEYRQIKRKTGLIINCCRTKLLQTEIQCVF